jgi:transposase-like protein
VSMTGKIDRLEVITSVQRRRRWSAEEKARMVQETYAPGMSVSLVARQHGTAAEPAVHLAAALCRGRALGGRRRRRGGGGLRVPGLAAAGA